MLIGDSVTYDGRTHLVVGFTPTSVRPAQVELSDPSTGATEKAHIRWERQWRRSLRAGALGRSRTISALGRGLLICGLLSLAVASPARAENVEVVVTLKKPPLADIFSRQRSLTFSSFLGPDRLLLSAPASRSYLSRLAAAHRTLQTQIHAAIPRAVVRCRYGIVLH